MWETENEQVNSTEEGNHFLGGKQDLIMSKRWEVFCKELKDLTLSLKTRFPKQHSERIGREVNGGRMSQERSITA